MNVYAGSRKTTCSDIVVTKNGAVLDAAPSLKLRNHSPDGFNWGYGGSGPAQLALGLLLDVTGDPETALTYYQAFKFEVVAGLGDIWTITDQEIRDWLKPDWKQPERDPMDLVREYEEQSDVARALRGEIAGEDLPGVGPDR